MYWGLFVAGAVIVHIHPCAVMSKYMLTPIINLVIFITYAVFALFGVLICVVGIVYMSDITGADKTAAGICIAAGVSMVLVSAAAVFATIKKKWLGMFTVLIIDVVLFVALLAACI